MHFFLNIYFLYYLRIISVFALIRLVMNLFLRYEISASESSNYMGNNWKRKEVTIKRGLLARMRAISDVVFLKTFLICKPRLLIFHNFQKLRKHSTPTGIRNQISKSTSMLGNECKINAPLSWGGMK